MSTTKPATRGSRRSPSLTKSTTAASSQQQQQQDRTPNNNDRSNLRSTSPQSPSRMTRLKEKEDLQNLNDRLVVYIDTVRRLESENTRLQSIVLSYSESSTRDVSEIKALFERELEDTKRLVDELAKDKAKLEIEVSKYRGEYEDVSTKLAKRERELKNLEARLKALELENQDLKSKNDFLTNDNNRKGDDLTNLRAALNDLEKQFNKIKKQLEEETLLRVDLENKNQTLKEDLAFKSTLYDKEVEQLRSAKRIEIEQVDTRLRDEYDSRLVLELQRIRDETEAKIAEMKDEVERRYQNKLADVEANAKRSSQYSSVMREEISNYKSKIDDLNTDIQTLQNKVASLEAKLRDTEDKLKKVNCRYDLDISARDAEITQLRKEIQDLLLEYQELYDVKIALDMEIGAYRKLLESEEQRLNISTAGGVSGVATSTSLSGSFLASSDDNVLRSGKKRRIAATEEETTSAYIQSATTSCGVDILEHDFDGKCVKLTNSSDKDVSLGGWQLKRLADGQETDYKFHKSTVIKPGQTITVWSSNTSVTHDPPVDLVMNTQRWFTGDRMITLLIDKDGAEQARRESQKSTGTVLDKKLRGTPTKSQTTTTSVSEVRITTTNSGSSSSAQKLFSFWKN